MNNLTDFYEKILKALLIGLLLRRLMSSGFTSYKNFRNKSTYSYMKIAEVPQSQVVLCYFSLCEYIPQLYNIAINYLLPTVSFSSEETTFWSFLKSLLT